MLTWPVGSGAASGGEGSVSVSSNHNLLPGLPPLEGHGSAGDTPSADDSPRGTTARQRAVSAWEPAGEPPPADPFDVCRVEIEHVLRELDELRVLIKQSSKELETLNQRKVLTAAKVREMEEHLEHHARKEIRATYLEANEAEMRAFMIGEQRDQM